MRIIKVSGTPMEMGRVQGEATGDDWVDLLECFAGIHIPETFQRDIAERCPRQMERMLGIAAGAAITLESALMFLYAEVVHGDIEYYLHGCSSIAVRGALAKNSEPVIACNLDMPRDWGYEFFARISEPDEAFKSVEITSGPMSGCRGGLNEKGLAISYNMGHAIDKPDKLVPISTLAQEALETCETTEQALQHFIESPRAGGALLMLADRSGDIASLELTAHSHGVRRPDKNSLAHTNHYHVPQLAAIDVPQQARYSDKMPEPLRGELVRESSECRHERLISLINHAETLDENSLAAIMSDHGELDSPSDNTICRHGPYYATSNSIALYPSRGVMMAASGPPCETKFETVALEI